MKNWKTTLAGVLGFAPTIINSFGPIIPPPYATFALGLFGLLGFVLSKDHNVTGGSINQ